VGFQINEEGLRVTDVIAGEHKLSEKANVSDIPSLDGYAKTEDIPSVDGFVKSEDLPNFDEFAKIEDIPSLDNYASKEWVNNRNYATEYDLKTIDYSSINNVPTLEDETGELNIADESGNIGMKVASEAVYAKDFVAGEHKLSEKVDKTYVDNSIAELVDGAPETLDTLNEIAAALKDNADIVDVLSQSISNKQDAITDLETIRQGAAKGATALQSYTEQYKGTVTGVKINGSTKNPSNGVVDLGTVITAHQDISGKADKSSLAAVATGGSYADLTNKPFNSFIYTGDIVDVATDGSAFNIPIVDGSAYIKHIKGIEYNYEKVDLSTAGIKFITEFGEGDWEIHNRGDGTKFLSDDGTYKTISGGGSSGANVQAVDTGDILDDVTVNYVTKTYVDGLIGDINSVLESIINGGVSLITFTIAGTKYQAEEGMTWEQWVNSEYNTSNYQNTGGLVVDATMLKCVYNATSSDIILNNGVYELTYMN
jgi:hypothetical protein